MSGVKITTELGQRIERYLHDKELVTWEGGNQRGTSNNTYTLKFTLRHHHSGSRAHAWLTNGGAGGSLKMWGRLNPPSPVYTECLQRTPEFEAMYFWICRKYPNDVITVQYRTHPPSA